MTEGASSVSYTHLDVYKRQVIIRTMAISGAICGIAGFVIVSGASPVSYTHLDVYKRQV